ncbi:MAG: c-type cytochrome [Chloroflexi bacterium]|nr:c-type cytochrome [Chloroflexota bacterium]
MPKFPPPKNATLIPIALILTAVLLTAVLISCAASNSNQAAQLDDQLAAIIQQANLKPIDLGETPDPAKVALGQALFFDKELSGSRDVACATCHHPLHNSHDELNLSIGVGGAGLGPERTLGEARLLIPRNAPDIYNRGSAEWQTMFWDGRIQILPDGQLDTPADEETPDGLDNVVAAQALFPLTSMDEMRGKKGDLDINDELNELAAMNGDDFTAIWQGVMARLLTIPEYVTLFAEAYPETSTDELDIRHAANAIGAFEIAAFSFDDSPWDRYLAGETAVLSNEAKQGAILFYGKANCAVCHSGNLMTDQQYHNILVPQIGPGHRDSAGYDIGRARVTDDQTDAFAFRTPPLRNITATGPWMHNGAYTALEQVIRHHIDPLDALQTYQPTGLSHDLDATFRNDLSTVLIMVETLDPLIENVPELSDEEIAQLLAFLDALTSETAVDLAHLIPDSVPSGLPILP